ncbi:histidinol-phosphate transaminase [Termitidicoccus mucosus]|uniref:Histidinol-phosphate aminotransferase n=1 Tax=Termitidicoccus mucosus TaxID=1184151 RepID=A0A178IHE6_9BACT|nr:aspartate aminotransferase [Opitutaceae bacterium TSB47]
MTPNPWIENLPVYEPGRPIEEVARELGFNLDEIIKVASNENELGPSPKAVAAMTAAAREMHRYPDGGCFYLKTKLAARLGTGAGNLAFGAGSNELIEFLGHIFLSPQTNMVVSDGSFAVYRLVAALFNSRAIVAPMKNFGHDLDAMIAAITPETRLIVVCNPNNPTGTALAPDALDRFIEKVPPHVLAVFDEAYFEYPPDAMRADLLKHVRAGRENVLLLRTFSKIYGLAGLRIGYAIGHERIIAALNRVRQPFNVGAMSAAAAAAALDDDAHLADSSRVNFAGLRFFEKNLPQIAGGLEYVPSFANFILVKTGRGREVFNTLQKRKIIVRPMDGYKLPDWIRITIGTEAQNTAVLAALREVLA